MCRCMQIISAPRTVSSELRLSSPEISHTFMPMLSLEYLADLLERNRTAARAQVREFSIGSQQFRFNSEPAIMGVINLSADSWYRESVCLSADSAIQRGRVLSQQGADIIDVGA